MARLTGPRVQGDFAVSVRGLTELQRALKRSDTFVSKRLRKELSDTAKDVRDTARSGVPHKTGRHGGSGIRLAPSIKSSATTKGASVYSDAPHAIVQDVGGRVGRNHATILSRASVSHYMTEAVEEAKPYVMKRMEGLLDDLARNFEE